MTGRYLNIIGTTEFQDKIEKSQEILSSCSLCPHKCGVDRLSGERGFCRIGAYAEVTSFGPHFGEESVLVGESGSGTIFFCGCNLLCNFCQNYEISQKTDLGCQAVSKGELANLMVQLQNRGCHNINFVTPSHLVPQILAALVSASENGLTVPLVYNCGGYESIETLQLLDGVIDIYMPDVKFFSADSATKYTLPIDYTTRMREALVEMQRQVGDLRISQKGLAEHGLLVRHLLMPDGLDDAEKIFAFLANEISKDCYINIMDQFRPCGEYATDASLQNSGIDLTISSDMYKAALEAAQQAGLHRFDQKDLQFLLKRLLQH